MEVLGSQDVAQGRLSHYRSRRWQRKRWRWRRGSKRRHRRSPSRYPWSTPYRDRNKQNARYYTILGPLLEIPTSWGGMSKTPVRRSTLV